MSKERLRKYIDNDITYQDYKMKKPIPQYLKLHTTLCEDIENVLEENQQLKEDYSKLLETSKAYKKLLKTTMQKEHQAIKTLDEINKDKVYWVNKCANAETMLHEREQVLDEIREYIKANYLFNYVYDEEELFEITSDRKAKEDLLQILDKVKE